MWSRTTRLEQEPQARAQSLGELMSLAAAMEGEALSRYAQLAAAMARRGDHDLAATFEAMLAEQGHRLGEIAVASTGIRSRLPPAGARPWHLPPEIARSWDEVTESALLTPYRALAIAVLNEERSFAFYSYVAAWAEEPGVRRAAEQLAAAKLGDAARLRRERRAAYRRERAAASGSDLPSAGSSAADFPRNARRIELRGAARHSLLAERLAVLGAQDEAALLRTIAAEERKAASPLPASPAIPESEAAAGLPRQSQVALLRAGLAESERLYEFYADLCEHAGAETMLLAAQQGEVRAIRHIALLSARLRAMERV